MPTATARRILARLPDDVFKKDEPTEEAEFNAFNHSFEVAGASADKAAEWTRTTNNAAVFEADTTTQGRLAQSPAEGDDLEPIVLEDFSYVLGEQKTVKPSRTAQPADFVQIQSDQPITGDGTFTHLKFNFAYISETDWVAAGIWVGEVLVDASVIWTVDLFNGASLFIPGQEVELPALGSGFHTFAFRLRHTGGVAYTGPLPTFLLDNIRLLRRDTFDPTVLWMILFGIASEQARIHGARQAIRSLLRIAESVGVDLQLLAADYGVAYPASLGLSDTQFRDLIRLCIVEPKTTNKTIIDVITVLTGAAPTLTEIAPSGGNPPILQIQLAGAGLSPVVGGVTNFWFYG